MGKVEEETDINKVKEAYRCLISQLECGKKHVELTHKQLNILLGNITKPPPFSEEERDKYFEKQGLGRKLMERKARELQQLSEE